MKRKTQTDETLHRVLVAVDLTAQGDRVLARLARLPLADDARVTLVHVLPANLGAAEHRRCERDAERLLAEEVRQLKRSLGPKAKVTAEVRSGPAALEISASAKAARCELVVMGRGGPRVLRDAFLGSTAERVVRQTQTPVLVVRLPARGGYTRPAIAIEVDQTAHEVVRMLLMLLPPPRPRVDVIHAFEPPYRGLIQPSMSDDEAEARTAAQRVEATRALARVLTEGLSRAGLEADEGPEWKTQVQCGSARTVVEKAVRKAETDLLVLGTHGYAGAAFAFLGTVAGDLLRAAACDVLMVPPSRKRR